MLTFAYTILYVMDVAKTIEFYEKAFEFTRTFITPDNSYGELSTGTTTLSFASIAQANTNLKDGFLENDLAAKPQAFEIAFTTDKVQEVFDRAVKYGATIESQVKLTSHGQTVGYVRDLNGFLVEICTPIV